MAPPLILKLASIAVSAALAVILTYQIFHDVITIEPIIVPKSLAEGGYTGEVAANRLRDSISNLVALANSSMQTPDVALQAELPDIVVPTFGLSLNAIAIYIRTFLGIGHHRAISGELFTTPGKLNIFLRMDGHALFEGSAVSEALVPDELIKSAASAILSEIYPYLVAAALYKTDRAQALQKANSIIALLPPSNENVLWAYTLKAMIFEAQGNYKEAETILIQVIQRRPDFAIAHQDLAVTFSDDNRPADAIREFHAALLANPSSRISHSLLGELLYNEDKFDKAIPELRTAAHLDPTNAHVRYVLGAALLAEGSVTPSSKAAVPLLEEACLTFLSGSYLDPTDSRFLDALLHVDSHFPKGLHCSPEPTVIKKTQ